MFDTFDWDAISEPDQISINIEDGKKYMSLK